MVMKLFPLACCQAGTIIGNHSRTIQRTLKGFGLNFGMAFQIIDDYKDIIGEEKMLGKHSVQDIIAGDMHLQAGKNMTVLQILESMGQVTAGDLIPVLQQVQTEYGYLPRDVLLEISRQTSIPASRIYGVATFYEQFYLEPRGRHTIKCCRGTACHVKHGREIINAVSQLLNIEPDQTTDDMRFTFETVACLGTCFLAPVMMIDNDYYGNLKPNQIESILKNYK